MSIATHCRRLSAALRRGAWLGVLGVAMATGGAFPAPEGTPNLKPFRPEGWPAPLVVSTRQGDHSDTRRLTVSDRLYVDLAVINDGGSAAAAPFRIDLLLDGALWKRIEAPAPLPPRAYRFREDLLIPPLGAGGHTLQLVIDAGGAIPESDESDNTYTRTLFVAGGCVPLSVKVSPPEGGILTASREANCGEATVSSSHLATAGAQAAKALRLGGEPIMRDRKARSVAALSEKAEAEGRVGVIVGLGTGARALQAGVASLSEARGRAPVIARAQQALLVRMSAHRLSSIRRFKFMPYAALTVDAAGLAALARDPEVVSIEEDLAVKPALEDSGPLVGAPQAWRQGYEGAGQAIAVLDTGVDSRHPFLAGKVVSEACYSGYVWTSLCPGGEEESTLPGSGEPCPSTFSECFHGTAGAGVAAGYGEDFSGVAPGASIIAIQVFSSCGEDCLTSSTSDWLAGIERIIELSDTFDIAAVNMSFSGYHGSPESCDEQFPAVKAAFDNLRALGIAPVVASGNSYSEDTISFPACISSAVSVGSTDGDASVSRFSNSSPQLDLLAPGRGIETAVPEEGFNRFNGTSMAAPHVAGAWALLKSKAPQATVPELLSLVKQTGIPVADPRNDLVKPRLQVDVAIDAVLTGSTYAFGTRLTLKATPRPGFRFAFWRGCPDASGDRCVVVMEEARSLTAVFEPLSKAAPDLVPTALTGPSTATLGRELALEAAIGNQGTAPAGPFRLGFYLSEDAEITREDLWFAVCPYPGLEAGASASCRHSFPLPLSIPAGRYYLGAIADDLDRVAETREANNALATGAGTIKIQPRRTAYRSFVPVLLSAEGRNDSFFTSELILTNRGAGEAALDFLYTAHAGGGSGTASDVLAPGEQKIVPDALAYLRNLGMPLPGEGNRIGTLWVEALAASRVGVMVRTTTPVPEGRAGLAYPAVAEGEGFHYGRFYLGGLRQNERDRSNVAVQHMGSPEDGPITLWVFSGPNAGFGEVTLEAGEFHQFSGALGSSGQGWAQVFRAEGAAPFYAYGVINDQGNSDGSFVFPIAQRSLRDRQHLTLPVIVEAAGFTSELTLTNLSEEAKTLDFRFVAEGLSTPDRTARFRLRIGARDQRILPDFIETQLRQRGVEGVRPVRGGLAGALFVTTTSGAPDSLDDIAIGARTSFPDGRGGRYGLFYPAVPDREAFTGNAWVDGLQQNADNRSNLALVNTGTVNDTDSVFSLEIYDGETGRPAGTLTRRVAARGWLQINAILATHAPGTRQGYVRIRQVSGANPFLAYGVINDGGAPGEGSGDGAYVPAVQ